MKRFGILLSLFLWASAATAGDRLMALRDVEVEAILRAFIQPLFQQAGLTNHPIRFVILLDPQINAAAGPGGFMLINSGFLLASKSAEEVVAVLAHETGHIAGGHLVRMVDAMQRNLMLALASAALGITGGLLLGSGEVAVAGAMGALQAGDRLFLSYTRGQESSADQAALRYLDELGWPLAGLASFLKVVDKEEFLASVPQNPYTRTHPPTEERISAMMSGVEQRQLRRPQRALPADFEERFKRVQAKLFAIANSPVQTMRFYKNNDFPSLYAQAIAHHRQGNTPTALEILDRLLQQSPNDAYIWDLKAQMLLESRKLEAACGAYEQALKLLPHDGLLMLDSARAFLALPKPNLNRAITLLEHAQLTEKDNPLLWHYLSIAYGKRGDMGMMALALAEEAAAKGDKDASKAQAERAQRLLKKDSGGYIRASDICAAVKEE